MKTDAELLRARAVTRPPVTLPTLFDKVEVLAIVLTSEEARLKIRDGLDVAPARLGQVRTFTGIRQENPAARFDLESNRPWTILDALIASLLASEARLAKLIGVASRPTGPDALAAIGNELAEGTFVRDPARFGAAVDELVTRTLAVSLSLDKPYVPRS
jgi:hypothetical protein